MEKHRRTLLPIELRPRRTHKCGINVAEPSSGGRSGSDGAVSVYTADISRRCRKSKTKAPRKVETQSRLRERASEEEEAMGNAQMRHGFLTTVKYCLIQSLLRDGALLAQILQ